MLRAIIVQWRVIYALILREVYSYYGKSRLGYLWKIVDAANMVLVFWGLRHAMGINSSNGMHILVFLIAGFGLFITFRKIVSGCISVMVGNKRLLSFPQVTNLDCILAHFLLDFSTNLVSYLLILLTGVIFGVPLFIADFGSLLFIVIIFPIFCLGIGLILASLVIIYPFIEHFIKAALRILMFTSGTFFSVSSLPSHILQYLWLNPITQFIEWTRLCLSKGYYTPPIDVPYILIWTFSSFCIGLLLERHVRGKIS
ncbi:MAG: ABC transporter permease [Desulfovibrionaceae bacterium]|nr:ABC transporter permease [Desulfovibrionaceae bacterium]